MAVIKLLVSGVVFYFLLQVRGYITPLFSWATNFFVLLLIAWTSGKYLTKKFVLPKLPQVPGKGKAVLVTGCDSGFGHSIALNLKKAGFHVFACCFDPEGEGAKSLISRSQGRNLTVISLDVTKEDSIKKCYEVVHGFLKDSANDVKELFAVVNNAGIAECRAIEMMTPPQVRDFQRILDVNLLGIVRVTRMFLPLVRQSKGRIINMSSYSARMVVKDMCAYSISKVAVSKFTDILQSEVSNHGVKVIALEPWATKTGIIAETRDAFIKAWNQDTPDEVKDAYGHNYLDKFLSNFSNLTDPKQIFTKETIAEIVNEAVTSPEPDAFYRVAPLSLDYLVWFINEIMPQDLRQHARYLLEMLRKK